MVFSATLTPGHLYGKPMTLTCAWFFYDISLSNSWNESNM